MNWGRASACRGHRAVLVDFVDRRELGSLTDPALAHLERCPDCELELERMALTMMVLRRVFAEAQRAEPPEDAWPRLRGRVAKRPKPRGWSSPASALVGAALVAVLAGPGSLGTPQAVVETPQHVADRLANLPEKGPGTSAGQRGLAILRSQLILDAPSPVRGLTRRERLQRVGEAPATSHVDEAPSADSLSRRVR